MPSTLKIFVVYPRAILRGKAAPGDHCLNPPGRGASVGLPDTNECWIYVRPGSSIAAVRDLIRVEIGLPNFEDLNYLGWPINYRKRGYNHKPYLLPSDIQKHRPVIVLDSSRLPPTVPERSNTPRRSTVSSIDQASEQVQRQAREGQRVSANRAPSSSRNASGYSAGSANRAPVSSHDTSEMGTLGRQIMNLERSLGPNDYDLLLRLDERSSEPTQASPPTPRQTPGSQRTSTNRAPSSTRSASRTQRTPRNSSKKDNTCIVCCDSQANACFIPCGHHNVCLGCAGRIDPKKCPSCRATFQQVIKMVGS